MKGFAITLCFSGLYFSLMGNAGMAGTCLRRNFMFSKRRLNRFTPIHSYRGLVCRFVAILMACFLFFPAKIAMRRFYDAGVFLMVKWFFLLAENRELLGD